MDDPLEENEPREPTDAERREQAAIIRQETDKMHDELMKREPMRFVLLQLLRCSRKCAHRTASIRWCGDYGR